MKNEDLHNRRDYTKLYRYIVKAINKWAKDNKIDIDDTYKEELAEMVFDYCVKHYQDVLNNMSQIVREIAGDEV